MARQDFLRGGYIGKLGATIGQRYHDTWYVRQYTPAQQPNTPAQLQARDFFRRATHIGQACLSITGGIKLFDTHGKGEFAQMVSVAMRGLIAGEDGVNLCALSGESTGEPIDYPLVCLYDSINGEAIAGVLPFTESTPTPTGLAFCAGTPGGTDIERVCMDSTRIGIIFQGLPGTWTPGKPTPQPLSISPDGYAVCFVADATPRKAATWYSQRKYFSQINSYDAIANYAATEELYKRNLLLGTEKDEYQIRYNIGITVLGMPRQFIPYLQIGLQDTPGCPVSAVQVVWLSGNGAFRLVAQIGQPLGGEGVKIVYAVEQSRSGSDIPALYVATLDAVWSASDGGYTTSSVLVSGGRSTVSGLSASAYVYSTGQVSGYNYVTHTYRLI
jgi:hypothetical protein